MCCPDAWGRRIIENKLKVAANKLPEVAYLLEAGSDRVGALDVRLTRDSETTAPCSPR
jgi:serine/threonine-protein kinase HipA